MAEGNGTTGCSDDHCKEFSILNNLNNPPSHYKVLDVLGATQFCEAFFHVPEVPSCEIKMQCLDKEKCRVIGKDKSDPKLSQPKHVVCLVVLKRGENDVKYKAIYENCVINEGIKTHAEEFFDKDAKAGKLSKLLDEHKKILEEFKKKHSNIDDLTLLMKGSGLDDLKLCMYITLQPCHYSTTNAPEKSCTDTMIKLYKDILEPRGIEFVVKPTFIHKAYFSTTDDETLALEIYNAKKLKDKVEKAKKLKKLKEKKELKEEVEKAKEGLRLLCKKGIKIQAMKEDDWIFLKNKLCPSCSKQIFAPGGSYEGSERKKLDGFIRGFLNKIKAEIAEEYENLLRKLEKDANQLLKWKGTKDELKRFLDLLSECEGLDLGEISEKDDNNPTVNVRFRSTNGSIFLWYNNKTLQCKGTNHEQNKHKLSELATAE